MKKPQYKDTGFVLFFVRNLVNSLYKKNNRQKRSRSHRAWAIAYLLYKLTRAPNRMRQ